MKILNSIPFTALLCSVGFSIGNGFPDFNFSIYTSGEYQTKVYLSHMGEEAWAVHIKKHTNESVGICQQTIFLETDFKDDSENEKSKKVPITSFGYQLVKGFGYYKLHKEKKTWQQALEICQKEQTHLSILNSEDEARAIASLMLHSDTLKQFHWIGFHGQFQENWYTISNKTIEDAGYNKWFSTSEPNTKPGQGECGLFRYDSSASFGLLDWGCSNLAFFICELEI